MSSETEDKNKTVSAATAEDSAIDPSVAIDNMKVKILAICQSPKEFNSVANFLCRRGWEVKSTSKLKEALNFVSKEKPDFVMVSVNHSNPQIKKIPTIIGSTFGTPCISFGEKSDTKTSALIQAMPGAHKIVGAVSGPNVLRKIKQILKEIYYPETNEISSEKINSEAETETIKVSGGAGKGKKDYTIQTSSSTENKSSQVIIQEGIKSKLKTSSAISQESAWESDSSSTQESESQSSTEDDIDLESFAVNLKTSENKSSLQIDSNLNAGASKRITTKQDSMEQDFSKESDKDPRNNEKTVSKNQIETADKSDKSEIESAIVESIKGLYSNLKESPPDYPLAVTQMASVCVEQNTQKNIIILVALKESPSFRQEVKNLIEQVEKKLVATQKGYIFEDMDLVEIEPSTISEPSEIEIKYTFYLPDDNSSIGVICYQEDLKDILIKEDKEKNLLKIHPANLAIDRPIDFDVFLFLEKNKKNIKLVKPSGKFHESIQKKLLEKKMPLYIAVNSKPLYKSQAITDITLKKMGMSYKKNKAS